MTFKNSDIEGHTLYFEGDNFCGEPMPSYSLSFVDDKFYCATINVIGNKHTYKNIVSLLSEKYGKPYNQYDDETIISTRWKFTDSSSIFICIIPDEVSISYTYEPLNRIIEQRKMQQKEKEHKEALKKL